MRRWVFVAVTAALVAAPCAADANAGSGSSAAMADRTLNGALHELVDSNGGPVGAIAVVQRGRKTSTYSAGRARLNGGGPTADDAMRLASTSKAFSGAVALALVSRGTLSLNDTIAARLPYLPAAWGQVTLGEALDHTSGLPNFTESASYLAALAAAPAEAPTPRQLVAFVENEALLFSPGSRYNYSNTDNLIVGLMVEQATGQSYEHELQSLVLAPLGLHHTRLPVTVAMPRPLFHGYQLDGGKYQDLSSAINPAWVWAAGGMVSTPADLNRFARGYVGGRLFSVTVRRTQARTLVKGDSEPPGPGDNSAGLAIFRYRTRCGTVYGHTGNFPGYTQFFAATLNGRRSATMSVNEQLRPDVDAHVFSLLERAETIAVCAALSH